MAYKNSGYRPQKKSRAILARAWEHIESVDYNVSARWLFYRLLQDGVYSEKSDYQSFLALTSRARHNLWRNWRPDTLTDETRERIVRGTGYNSVSSWARSIAGGISCTLDKWIGQSFYVQVWFEANAMTSQFKHHTRYITLVPFGGMPSIPYKWEIAKSLERAAKIYGLPIKVLYFGDLDPAGETIGETSLADIRGWCDADFEFIRAGLNPGDPERYNIPENPDHPGAYQWEALDATAAGELIRTAVGELIDGDAIRKVEGRQREAERAFSEYVKDFRLEG